MKKAFTLIEILVVISVIALLLAILMPALAAARAQTRSLVCKMHLRQLLLANISYASENDGKKDGKSQPEGDIENTQNKINNETPDFFYSGHNPKQD